MAWFVAEIGRSVMEAATEEKLIQRIAEYYGEDADRGDHPPEIKSLTRYENDEECILGEAKIKQVNKEIAERFDRIIEDGIAEAKYRKQVSCMQGRL